MFSTLNMPLITENQHHQASDFYEIKFYVSRSKKTYKKAMGIKGHHIFVFCVNQTCN